jgi:ribonuclease-3
MGRTHNSYMAGNAFEALVGAVYLDRGYEYCKWFVRNRILGKYINLDRIAYKESNFKSRLLEWCQKYHVVAEFELLEESKEEATLSPRFLTRVLISGVECGRGVGYSKKESHQQASKEALSKLNKNNTLRTKVLEVKTIENNGDNIDNTSCVCAEEKSAGQLPDTSGAVADAGAQTLDIQG